MMLMLVSGEYRNDAMFTMLLVEHRNGIMFMPGIGTGGTQQSEQNTG